MGRESIRELEEYLRKLAPRFFTERMRGATDSDIARLETAAGTALSDSHREFLRVMGATSATALNPFLNDRDFCVETLVADYALIRESDESLPPSIVVFSSSEILGERIFLRNGPQLSDEPEVGDVSDMAPTANFFPKANAKFESWLQSNAFWFRLSQPEHQLAFTPPLNADLNRFEGDPDLVERLLTMLGFLPVFRSADGERCLDRGDVATCIYVDGSGTLAGDDPEELEKIAAALLERTPLTLERVTAGWRNRAARE